VSKESIENLARGRELVEAGLEFAPSRGHVHHVIYSRRLLLRYMFHDGLWDDYFDEADELLEWDRARGGSQIEPWVLADSALVLVNRGRQAQGAGHDDAALPQARENRRSANQFALSSRWRARRCACGGS
jgi:hypothetical protein